MDELDDPKLPDLAESLIFKYSIVGTWRRFKARFWRRGKKKFFAYGFLFGLVLMGLVYWLW
jgi:tetrahydromethanopterin S-methyltransferase subunit B